jgi:hypothetical protein
MHILLLAINRGIDATRVANQIAAFVIVYWYDSTKWLYSMNNLNQPVFGGSKAKLEWN